MNTDDFSLVIPARLNSLRFKKKIIYQILKLPMIEHVRRRALLSDIKKNDVYVATSNQKIIKIIKKNNGKVLITKKKHLNGTSRVAEVIGKIKSKYTIIVQGDEPLFYPEDINKIIKFIKKNPNYNMYNTISSVNKNQYNDNSIVKCNISQNGEIINFYRKQNNNKKSKIRKILGIIIFKSEFLKNYPKLIESKRETKLSIEQLKFLDNKIKIKSIYIKNNSQSVNYLSDIIKVKNELKINVLQKKIYEKILKL